MPVATIASAVSRTICSLTLQANLFQLFQPIGGVSARPFGALLTTSWVVSASGVRGRPRKARTTAGNSRRETLALPHALAFGSCVSATNRAMQTAGGENAMKRLLGMLAAMVLAFAPVAAHAQPQPLPHLVSQNGKHALIVDGAPFLMLGAQTNNSSNYPAVLPKVWPVIRELHANTRRDPDRLGADRAGRRPLRFLLGRHPARRSAAERCAARALVVRDMEEHQPRLHARMGQGRHRAASRA